MPSGFEQLAARLLVEERFLAVEREEAVDTDEVRRRAARRLQNHPDATRLFFRHVVDEVADEIDTEAAPERQPWGDGARPTVRRSQTLARRASTVDAA